MSGISRVRTLEELGEGQRPYRSLWKDAAVRFSRNRVAMFGLLIIVVLAILAIAAPLIEHHRSSAQDYAHLREGPSWKYWLGTDLLGRDQWSRLVNGARISLSVGILTQLVAVSLGLTVGLAAGLRRAQPRQHHHERHGCCLRLPGLADADIAAQHLRS